MNLYPAIDLLNKRCVRLYKGEYSKVTDYGDPIEMARKWKDMGATFLHLVDLDGAKVGKSVNLDVVKNIIDNVGIDCELGGGIRTLEKIDEILSIGVKRVILGSAALKNPTLVKEAIEKYGPERIVVGVDTKNFKVATEGWIEESNVDALEFAHILEKNLVKYIIFTDISKDGTLEGFNVEQTKKLIDNTNINIIASGGVKTIEDLRKANEIGCEGIIIGKAMYEGTIDLKKAIEEFK
jgi:phosphoribosylformimino-5-aminoimidazole carboxamide ribotide isomerase